MKERIKKTDGEHADDCELQHRFFSFFTAFLHF